MVYRNGTRVKFAYDADGALRLLCGRYPGTPPGNQPDVFDFTEYHQTVDGEGLVQRTTHAATGLSGCGDNNLTFTDIERRGYDSRHQVIAHDAYGDSAAYTYDASGNMTRRQVFRGSTPTLVNDVRFTIDPGHNRLREHFDAATMGPDDATSIFYDPNGDRIVEQPHLNGLATSAAGSGYRQYWYDVLGRITGTSEWACAEERGEEMGPTGACTATGFRDIPAGCHYDPLGRMFNPCQTALPVIGYDGENAIRTQSDMDDQSWSFVHGPGLDDPLIGFKEWDRYVYFVTDGAGRQLAVGDTLGIDATSDAVYQNGGKLAGGARFGDSFWSTRQSNPEMFRLSFFRNRFYDQHTGRWTQEDPIGVAGGINLYQFNGNNPVNFSDPFGLNPIWGVLRRIAAAAARGAVVGAAAGAGTRMLANAVEGQPLTEGVGQAARDGAILGAVTFGASAAAQVLRTTANVARGVRIADDIVDATLRNADEIKVGRTAKNAGDFVNIKFKDGTVANIRVETHPPHGLHGNVQVWKKGEETLNKHILP